jgi:hypothetical protein
MRASQKALEAGREALGYSAMTTSLMTTSVMTISVMTTRHNLWMISNSEGIGDCSSAMARLVSDDHMSDGSLDSQ